MNIIISSLLVLGTTGIIAALVLYLVSRKFKVHEDPRIDEIEGILPGANCGGCGSAGCRNFAERCIKAGDLSQLSCPVGGNDTMAKVAGILGLEAIAATPKIAVLRCNGTCSARPKTNSFDGAHTCRIENSLYIGESGCRFGCLGCGDCTNACQFGGITINPETGLPRVDESLCTGCGECARECPRHLIELRPKGIKGRRLYVSCKSNDKGAVARKACQNACIGCGKCVKECKFEAITVTDNLAYIDPEKCRLCRKCLAACPTGAIKAVNFPEPKNEAAQQSATQE